MGDPFYFENKISQYVEQEEYTYFILFQRAGNGESLVRMDLWNGLASGSLNYSRAARSSTVKRIRYRTPIVPYLKVEAEDLPAST
jgi:hypothetical protein